MDILANGRLAVKGGNSFPQNVQMFLFGGAGGIIQIISPKGSLVAGSLFLNYGSSSNFHCKMNDDADGYFYLRGKKIYMQ